MSNLTPVLDSIKVGTILRSFQQPTDEWNPIYRPNHIAVEHYNEYVVLERDTKVHKWYAKRGNVGFRLSYVVVDGKPVDPDVRVSGLEYDNTAGQYLTEACFGYDKRYPTSPGYESWWEVISK